MRSRITLLVILFAFLVAACGGDTASASVELVPARVAASAIEATDVVVLDIRTPEEFQGGHIEGAINIDFYATDFADQLAQLDRGTEYVMYCRSGNRSAEAAKIMKDLEFAAVDEIDGGILSWVGSGFPIVLP